MWTDNAVPLRVKIRDEIPAILPFASDIQRLADAHKEELGFIPASSFEEAIKRGRIIAAIYEVGGRLTLAGYLMHGGVFPSSKIVQIAVQPSLRREGVAASLMRYFASDRERAGYNEIRADIASNLPAALSFYRRNAFEPISTRAGGQSRKRMIIQHVRPLDSDNLFSMAARRENSLDLSVPARPSVEPPLLAIDLNVFLDLAKSRIHADIAQKLFGAALRHEVRLAVADEFVAELRRTSVGVSTDVVLQMALQLPRLPKADSQKLAEMSAQIHQMVFAETRSKQTGSGQARSDAKHLAHAALSRATAFITRDGKLLDARSKLLAKFGIDLAALAEINSWFLVDENLTPFEPSRADTFVIASLSKSDFIEYSSAANVEGRLPKGLPPDFRDLAFGKVIIDGDDRVAVGLAFKIAGSKYDYAALVHVLQEHADCSYFAEVLLDGLLRTVSSEGAVTVRLAHLPGQHSVNQVAAARGFTRSADGQTHNKIALGRPLTAHNWVGEVSSIRRRTGLILPEVTPKRVSDESVLNVKSASGKVGQVRTKSLEDYVGPSLYLWPSRPAVIAPINRTYSDELLGTSMQSKFDFIGNKDAAFFATRAYISTPRAAKLMKPDGVIFFYESLKNGGRGAVVAVARVVDSLVVKKDQVAGDARRRIVVEDVEAFSATRDVLLTRFDNLLALPSIVSFARLKRLEATGGTNLVTSVSITSSQAATILSDGWSGSAHG